MFNFYYYYYYSHPHNINNNNNNNFIFSLLFKFFKTLFILTHSFIHFLPLLQIYLKYISKIFS
jgi:hypothetical protein